MKSKKLIVCILALCASLTTTAQISVYADDGVMAGQLGTIVRSWGSDFGVTYYWVGNQPYLDPCSCTIGSDNPTPVPENFANPCFNY